MRPGDPSPYLYDGRADPKSKEYVLDDLAVRPEMQGGPPGTTALGQQLGPTRSGNLTDPLLQYRSQGGPLDSGRRPKGSTMFKRKQMFLDLIKDHKLKQKQANLQAQRTQTKSPGEQDASESAQLKP